MLTICDHFIYCITDITLAFKMSFATVLVLLGLFASVYGPTTDVVTLTTDYSTLMENFTGYPHEGICRLFKDENLNTQKGPGSFLYVKNDLNPVETESLPGRTIEPLGHEDLRIPYIPPILDGYGLNEVYDCHVGHLVDKQMVTNNNQTAEFCAGLCNADAECRGFTLSSNRHNECWVYNSTCKRILYIGPDSYYGVTLFYRKLAKNRARRNIFNFTDCCLLPLMLGFVLWMAYKLDFQTAMLLFGLLSSVCGQTTDVVTLTTDYSALMQNFTGYPHADCDELFRNFTIGWLHIPSYIGNNETGNGVGSDCAYKCTVTPGCIGFSFSDMQFSGGSRCGLQNWYCPEEKLIKKSHYTYRPKKGNDFDNFDLHERLNCTSIPLDKYLVNIYTFSEEECYVECVSYHWCRTFYHWVNASAPPNNPSCHLSQRYCQPEYFRLDNGLLYTRKPSTEEYDQLYSHNHLAILTEFDLIQNVYDFTAEKISYYPPITTVSPVVCALVCVSDPFCLAFSYCYKQDWGCIDRYGRYDNCQLLHTFSDPTQRLSHPHKHYYLKKATKIDGYRRLGHRICPMLNGQYHGSYITWHQEKDMTEERCSQHCDLIRGNTTNCTGIVFTKMGLNEEDLARTTLTSLTYLQSALYQCGIVSNWACSELMMVPTNWSYQARKLPGIHTRPIEQKSFWWHRHVFCGAWDPSETIQGELEFCKKSCLNATDCVGFEFRKADVKGNYDSCRLMKDQICQLLGPNYEVDSYTRVRLDLADDVDGFHLDEGVECGLDETDKYLLGQPLSDSLQTLTAADCAKHCRDSEFCRSFIFFGPKGGWDLNLPDHKTALDQNDDAKVNCRISYVRCHPDALKPSRKRLTVPGGEKDLSLYSYYTKLT